MGVLTNLLKLLKPSENDYYNQQTEQADNWDKVDDYAVLTNTDKNGIWGGEYGGKIQDPIPKELNKRYIDNINGKAFICIKAGDSSVTSNTTEYFTPCNVVDNLGKLQNLVSITYDAANSTQIAKIGNIVRFTIYRTIGFDSPPLQPYEISASVFKFPFALKKIHSIISGGSVDNVTATRYFILSTNNAGVSTNDNAQLIIYNSSNMLLDIKGITFSVIVEGEI